MDYGIINPWSQPNNGLFVNFIRELSAVNLWFFLVIHRHFDSTPKRYDSLFGSFSVKIEVSNFIGRRWSGWQTMNWLNSYYNKMKHYQQLSLLRLSWLPNSIRPYRNWRNSLTRIPKTVPNRHPAMALKSLPQRVSGSHPGKKLAGRADTREHIWRW